MATSYDYAPLFRSSIGFDRVFNLLENAQRARSISDWPPYDIVKTGDTYRISIAVAGFAQDDLDITFQSNLLTVTGKKQETSAGLSASRHCRPSVRTPVPGGTEAAPDLHPERSCFDLCCSDADRSAEGGLSYIVRSTWAP
ncbi:UNVERIFIED_ORG: hypothetical protein M2435_005078 [Rhizobium sophorae]|nr:hsp20/alpha crystallin family protein [Rhizobium leguminosarum bv. viciae]MBB4524969.1 hypothetical protein [Rhizobium leguminosarum]MDH6662155.1 hypothetical protein [Rhizobium sophorae]